MYELEKVYVHCFTDGRDTGVHTAKEWIKTALESSGYQADFSIESLKDIDRFFEIWTLKEAFFKCKGTGLGSDIKSVCFEITEGNVSCSDNGYSLFFEKTSDGYVCSVCIKK